MLILNYKVSINRKSGYELFIRADKLNPDKVFRKIMGGVCGLLKTHLNC